MIYDAGGPNDRLWAEINLPGLSREKQIANNQSMDVLPPVKCSTYSGESCSLDWIFSQLPDLGKQNKCFCRLSF